MKTEGTVLQQKLDSAIKHYNFLLSQKEKAHAEELKRLEAVYKHSWKWKTGNFLVESFIRCANFLKNPFKFILNPGYRGTWKEYNSRRESFPGKTVPTSFSEIIPPVPDTGIQVEVKPSATMQVNVPVSESTEEKCSLETVKTKQVGNKPVIAAILDEIQEKGLQPEVILVTFRPDNWRTKLESQAPDILLIESALMGNQGSWQYKIAKPGGVIGDEFLEMIQWAKIHQIPSFFWFTVDPLAAGNFYHEAGLCDYILTNNGDELQKFRKAFGQDRIFSFPFAIQPKIHHPVSDGARNRNICFPAGKFFNKTVNERKDLEILLKPSMSLDLDIWDRNFGFGGYDSGGNGYPAMYLPFIKGRLSYDNMLKRYRRYKVVLNTERVKDSASQVSRRVMESLACGTPVISSRSKAITDIFGDVVFIAETEADTSKYLELLLNNHLAWTKASVAGIRKVMEFHRVDQRLSEVFNQIKIAGSNLALPDICILVNTGYCERPELFAKKIAAQTYAPKAVVLLSEHNVDRAYADELSVLLGAVKVHTFEYYQNQLNNVIHDAVHCDYYAIWDSKDAYGPEYLRDYALATRYCSNNSFGKGNYYRCDNNQVTEENAGEHHRFTYRVPVSTLMIPWKKLSSFNFLLLTVKNSFYESFVPDVLSLDSLNFVKNMNENGEPEDHVVKPYFA